VLGQRRGEVQIQAQHAALGRTVTASLRVSVEQTTRSKAENVITTAVVRCQLSGPLTCGGGGGGGGGDGARDGDGDDDDFTLVREVMRTLQAWGHSVLGGSSGVLILTLTLLP
jgi:hypothetical protein